MYLRAAVIPARLRRRMASHPLRPRPRHGARPGGLLDHPDPAGSRPHPPHRDRQPAAGSRTSLARGERLIAIAMPTTPDAADLPGAQREAAYLGQRFPGHVTTLTGPQATRSAVLAALRTACWAHFACHGSASLADPSRGQLLLHDHQSRPLTVLDITRLRLTSAHLAFLSACSTARPSGRLTNEAIHLASTFQLAGYRHVIATLWPISDRYAASLAEGIYTALTTGHSPAHAVHRAVRDLRDYRPRFLSLWASYLHTGA